MKRHFLSPTLQPFMKIVRFFGSSNTSELFAHQTLGPVKLSEGRNLVLHSHADDSTRKGLQCHRRKLCQTDLIPIKL